MKRLIMITILMVISLTNQLQAQKIDKNIQLDNDVFTKKYTLEVDGKSDLKIKIKSTIKDGGLLINVYNPAGELEEKMDLDASIGQSKSASTIERNTDNPMPGVWVIEVENKRALGEVSIEAKS